MGISIRKRTKGKSSWLNFSASKKAGLKASYSQKLGKNLTLNFSKSGTRATYNLGNGIRITSTRPKKKHVVKPQTQSKRKTQSKKEYVYSYTRAYSPPVKPKPKTQSSEFDKIGNWTLIIIMTVVITIIQLYMRGS